jgi:hypothetical protein
MALAVLLACTGPIQAGVDIDALTEGLGSQGFDDIKVFRTLLGRTQIIADGPAGHREIVLDPRTGQILRDIFRDDEDRGKGEGARSGSGAGDDGDHDDDHDGGEKGGGGGDDG